jgi:hypothetical protein
MKIGNDYWYRHSRSDVKSSRYRLAVMNPTGSFILDGKTVPRSADVKKVHALLKFAEMDCIRSRSVAVEGNLIQKSKSAISDSPVVVRPYSPDRHYNRLSTPNNEKEEIERAEIRKDRIAKFKHLFFDDNYVVHPVSKLGRDLSPLLPATRSVDCFEKTMNKKLSVK